MKTMYIAGIVVIAAVIIGSVAMYFGSGGADVPNNSSCTYGQLNYYFRSDCSHCIRVLNDGSLERLQEFGVQVEKFEVVEWGMYGVYATPTFEFGEQRVKSYKTFEELKVMLGC